MSIIEQVELSITRSQTGKTCFLRRGEDESQGFQSLK